MVSRMAMSVATPASSLLAPHDRYGKKAILSNYREYVVCGVRELDNRAQCPFLIKFPFCLSLTHYSSDKVNRQN